MAKRGNEKVFADFAKKIAVDSWYVLLLKQRLGLVNAWFLLLASSFWSKWPNYNVGKLVEASLKLA